eukprot:2947562-Rhodomonas_salina.1
MAASRMCCVTARAGLSAGSPTPRAQTCTATLPPRYTSPRARRGGCGEAEARTLLAVAGEESLAQAPLEAHV